MLGKTKVRERYLKELVRRRETAAQNLIRYVEGVVNSDKDFPRPTCGSAFDCADCFFENLLDAAKSSNPVRTAEFLMHGILALRLPLGIKEIKAWRRIETKWRRYRARHKKTKEFV